MHGAHLTMAEWKTQSNIALSSGEAEFYSMVHATSEALGMQAMMQDYHDGLDPWLYVDASAAIGMAQRTGLGKIRHLDTADLWVQERLKNGDFQITKVPGSINPADALTKFLDAGTLQRLISLMSLVHEDGRAASAPALTQGILIAPSSKDGPLTLIPGFHGTWARH